MDDITDDRLSVYEIGYLIAASVPEEKVPGEAEAIKKIITDAGAEVIAEEAPRREQLAYPMRKKMVSGAYDTYDSAYFGWIKFELGSDTIEAVKKAVEAYPSVLRMLLISTVRENTYLGKRAATIVPKSEALEDKKETAAPATIEEMDKSIDAMVKEV